MAGQFRQRRFSGRGGIGENVNPSEYIVNLADCMLVLACGVIVALVSYFNVDLTPGVRELDGEQMTQVDPETMPEDIGEGSNYYVEAGVVYRDPSTGQLYMVEDTGEAADDGSPAETGNQEDTGTPEGTGGADAG